MKKILLMALTVAAFAFVGCSDDDDAQVASSAIEVVKSQVGFEAEGGQGTIELKVDASAGAVTATSSKDWVVINSADAKAVTYTVGVSTEAMLRTADITIKAGKDEQVVTILQNGSRFTISTEPVEVDPSGETSVTIPYKASNSELPVVTIPDDAKEWLTAEVTAEGIKLTGALNYVAERQTTIAVKQGWKPQEIVVSQGTVRLIEAADDAYDPATSTINRDADPVTFTVAPTKYMSHVTEPWELRVSAAWIEMSEADASGSRTVNVPLNDTKKARTGKIELVVDGKVLQTITVNQGEWSLTSLCTGTWTMTYKNWDGDTVTTEVSLVPMVDASGNVAALEIEGFELGGTYFEYKVVDNRPRMFTGFFGYWNLGSNRYLFLCPLATTGTLTWSPTVTVDFVYSNNGTTEAFTLTDNGSWANYTVNGLIAYAFNSTTPSSSAIVGGYEKYIGIRIAR